MKTKTNPRRGQGVVEFCLAAPILIGVVTATVVLLLLLFSRSVLDVESYRIARARLYGSHSKPCSPGEIFAPSHPLTRFVCTGSDPRIEAQMNWHREHAQKVRWDLRTGEYFRSTIR